MKKIYLLLSLFVVSFFTKLTAQVSLTATSGTLTGTYTTLKAAFDAINIGTHKGDIVIEISANTVETAPATLLSGDADPTNYSSLTIYPTADGVSVSGCPGSGFGVIQLNGADNVLIDGDNPNTAGTNKNLTIVNTCAPAITFTSCLRVATLAGASAKADNIFLFNTNFTGNVTSGNIAGITGTNTSSNNSFGIYFGGKGSATSTLSAITSETADAALAGTTMDNIVIDNIAVNQSGRGIVFNGAATNVSSSISITNSIIGTTAAVSGHPVTTPASTVYTKGIWIAGTDALYVASNTIQNIISYIGTTIVGIELASNIGAGSITIDANTINGVSNNGTGGTANGILVSSVATKFTISSNTVNFIQGIFTASASPVAGINIATTGGTAEVIKNTVSSVYNRNTGGYGALGIYFSTAANASEISNNFVYDIMNWGNASFTNTTENASGILIASGSSHRILHNSVHLSGVSPTSSASNVVTCFSVSSSAVATLDIRNNIFSNTVTGGGATTAHVCMYFPFSAAAAAGYVINNNAYYTGSTAGLSGIAFAGASSYNAANLYDVANFNPFSTTAANNFRNWSTATGVDNNDFASFGSTAAAPFVSATNLHIVAGANRLESGGVATSITTDIDNAGRGTFPDIGADEFAGTIQDLTAPLITYTPLTGTCTLGARTLTVNIKDPSGVPVGGAGLPVLYWRINAGAYAPVTATSLGGGNYSFTFGAGAVVPDVVSYYIVAQDGAGTPNVISAPSVGAGGFTANVPAAGTVPTTPESYLVQTNLAPGVYPVGAAQLPPFNTLTAAVNRYNTSCLSGAVVFELTDATYAGSETFPIVIGNPSVTNLTNTLTLTIRPAAGVNATITGSSTDALIKFNGADWVTIDGSNNGTISQNLTITNSNASTTSAVIWMASASASNGATHNVIKNSTVTGNATATTYACIFSGSGSTIGNIAATANSFNTYQNVTVHTAYQGIVLLGASTGDNNDTIINSKIGSSAPASQNLGYRGIYISNQTNVNISDNIIQGIVSTFGSNSNVAAGISVRGAISNGIITLNRISDCKHTSTAGWTVHGITLQSTSPNCGLSVYNNFIWDIAGFGYDPNVTDNGHGIGILAGGGYRIYYNSIALTTNQSEGNSAAIFIDNRTTPAIMLPVPSNLNIRNNIFSNQQTAFNRYSIYSAAPASAFTNINYNDYYTAGATLGFLGSARANLAAWQSATGGDVNSVSVIPLFSSATNLHLSGASTLNNLGTNIAGFTTDIDIETRNLSTPDMGADEFTPPDCGGVITAGTVAASKTTICVTDSIVLSSTGFSFGNGMVYQWQSSPDNATWTAISGKRNPSASIVPVSTTTYFRLTDTCTLTSTPANSASVLVTVNSPSVTASGQVGSLCGLGTASLSATGSGGTTLRWFDVLSGGLPVGTGSPFTTPTINTTTNYYVEAIAGLSTGSVGPVSPTAQGGTIGTQTVSWDVGFDVIQSTTLISVDVFPLAAGGSGTLNVYNSSNVVIASIPYTYTVSGGATAQTIPINVPLAPGSYYLEDPALLLPGSGASRNTSGAVYPYTSSAINITGNGFDQTYFMCYYNWQFTSGCASAPRTTVVATVATPPVFSHPTTTPGSAICQGSGSISIDATDADYSTYSWSPAAGLSSTNTATTTATPVTTTLYTVTVGNGVCSTSDTVTITVNPTPNAVTITPAGPIAFCSGAAAQMLTASGGSGDLFRERFETTPFTKFAVSDARLSATQNTTYYQEGTRSVRVQPLSHNISDASPSAYEMVNNINLSLYSNSVLTFYHMAAFESTFDFGYVEYTTDNGTTWVPFPTSSYTGTATLKNGVVSFDRSSYTDWNGVFTSAGATPGAGPGTTLWKLETINLAPWQASTQFKIRFRIKTDVSELYYGWMLDDVKINSSGTLTWSPVTDLYTDAAATVPYVVNTNFPVVYTKPTANRTYTATAKFGSCPSTATVDVNLTSNPISLTIASAQGTTVCGADTVDFSIPAQNVQAGTPFYDWRKNGTTITGSATGGSSVGTTVTVASTATLFPGMRVSVSAGTGFFQANTIITGILSATQFTVNLVPSIALSGATVSATATGSTVTSLRYSDIANGDAITCVLSVGGTPNPCIPANPVNSNSLTFTILATTATSVSISASATTICATQSVTFTATPTNGGAAPTYEWFVGVVSQGAPSASVTFTTSALANGNVVTCRMYSNASNCPFPKAPYSNPITMTVNPSFPVSVSITSSPAPSGTTVSICSGTSVTFTATPTNGGVTPDYQWQVNGVNDGTNSPTFTTTTLADLDIVRVILTSSIASCALNNPDTSNLIDVSVTTQVASVTIAPVTAICAGIARTYTATPINGGATPQYEWFINGGSVQGPNGTDTYTYTPATGDLVEVRMASALTCATPNPAIFSFNQTVNAAPTAAITGSNIYCPGVPVVLNSNAAAGSGSISTIQWRLNFANIGTGGPTHTATTFGNYKVIVTNSNGCVDSSAVFTVTDGSGPLSGTYYIGRINAANVNGATTTLTATSTANLVVGALLTRISGGGTLAANTVVTSIVDATTFTVNTAPTVALAGAVVGGADCDDYLSFATAIADLNTRFMGGNCIFNVQPGYVENLSAKMAALGTVGLNATAATRTLAFQKNGAGTNPKIVSYTGGIASPGSAAPDGIFTISGTDNVTIDGVDLEENAANVTVATTMEYGYGLFKLAAGDGVQNATIRNCVITLNRVNNAAPTAPMVEGSVGILVINSTATAAVTPLTPTNGGTVNTNGSNSNNKFYTNTIQNCNHGIALSGYAAAAGVGPTPTATTFLGDLGNDIGGAVAGNGNTILNYGGGGALQANGIRAINQWGLNVSYNTINNNNGSGANHAGILRGIYGQAGTSANVTISNNTVTMNGGATTAAVTAIENAIGGTPLANTVSINTNVVSGTFTSTTVAWIGILNSATAATVNMNSNTVQNVSFAGAGAFTAISNTAAIATALNINSNIVTGNSKAAGAAMTFIAGGSPVTPAAVSISSNTITNNTMVGGGAAATMLGITMAGTSTYTVNGNTVNNNSITGMTGAAIATLSGFSNIGGTQNETLSGNTFSNLFVTGTSTGLQIVRAIHNNTTGTSTRNVNTNTIFNLYTSSAMSAVVTGINSQLGGNTTISRNWVYNLFPGQSATAGSIAKGIGISSGGAGTTNTVSNNMIALDLTLAASATGSVAGNSVLTGANSLIGIEMTSVVVNSNIALYFNSIRLAGTGGTNFGSSAVLHTANATSTTASLTMTNNILDNESTPNGTGLAVAYRRSAGGAGTLANHVAGATNLFYAGTPGANNLIYSDGTSTAQTITAYIGGVFTAGTIAPRDAASLSDLPNFLSQTDLHLNAADNCALNGTGTLLAITIDYDNAARNNPPDIGADEFAGTGAFGTWAGVNTNWNDPINWCGGVPTASTNVIIPSPVPNYPIITASGPVARNITIDPGASVTINGTGILDIKGNLVNSGTLNNSGEITMTGSIAQSLPGAAGTIIAMKKLTIVNTSGANPAVTINQNLTIDDVITPTQGVVNLNNVYVTLRSKVDSTARIGVVGGSFTYTGTGNFVVERYFPGRRAWRLISAPIVKAASKTVFNSWQAGGNNSISGNATFVTGPGANLAVNGLDGSPMNSASLKAFNYATSGFVGVPATKGASLPSFPAGATGSYLTDTTGYFMFVRGDRTPANPQPFNPFIIGNATTLRDTGIVKTGAFAYTCNPTTVTHLYTLIGNPYASPVDFALLGRTSIANKFQVWDPTLSSVGGWAVWNGGVITPGGTILTNTIIQSKQAFVVETTGAGPQVTFSEAAKSSTYNANWFRPAPLPAASLNVSLYFKNADGTDQLADGTLAKFNDEYSNESDHLDAVKFTNVNETFCIKNGSNYFMQDFRPFLNSADTLFFNFARARQFTYKFNFTLDNVIRLNNRVAYLHDRFLGTAVPLNMQGSTEVNFEVNSNAASSAADRFFVTFKKVAKFKSIAADVLYSDATVNWSVENASLVNHYEVERSTDGKTFEKAGEASAMDNGEVVYNYTITDLNLAPGDYYYRIKAVSNSHGAFDYSDVAKVKVLKGKEGLYVYPNPVTDGIIGLKMNAASAEGKYAVRLVNAAGQAVTVQQFQHIKATQSHSIAYPSYLAGGAYQLEVTGPDKKKSVIGVVITKK